MRRRIAVATWRAPADSRMFTRMTVDATQLLAYVDGVHARTGERVTVTHVVGAALGRALRAVPEMRTRVLFGRIVAVETCDIAFAVDMEDGRDLAAVKVCRADEKSPLDIARELRPGAAQLRAGEPSGYRTSSSFVRHLPWWTLRPVFRITSLMVGGLGVGAFGQPGFPLGSAFVSSVGTLGLDEGWLAPLPFARAPLYLSIGAVKDGVGVRDGAVVVQPQLVLGAVGDHRLIDGAHAGQVASMLRELLSDPWQLEKKRS